MTKIRTNTNAKLIWGGCSVALVFAGCLYYVLFVEPQEYERRIQGHHIMQWQAGQLTNEQLIPQLIDGLSSSDMQVLNTSVNFLAQLGPQAVPALINGLKDPRQQVRIGSAAALSRMGPPAQSAISALIRALEDSNPHVRGYSAAALGRIGPAAQIAIEPLTRLSENPDETPHVRHAAQLAIGAIGNSQPQVPAEHLPSDVPGFAPHPIHEPTQTAAPDQSGPILNIPEVPVRPSTHRDCITCNARGNVTCWVCFGRGSSISSDPCWKCHGRKKITCRDCLGKRKIFH